MKPKKKIQWEKVKSPQWNFKKIKLKSLMNRSKEIRNLFKLKELKKCTMRLTWKQKYIEKVIKLSSPGLNIQNNIKYDFLEMWLLWLWEL